MTDVRRNYERVNLPYRFRMLSEQLVIAQSTGYTAWSEHLGV